MRDNSNKGILKDVDLKMVSAAATIADSDKLYTRLQGNTSTPRHIIYEINANDPVATWPVIGNNPATTALSGGKNQLGNWIHVLSGQETTAHNCYGLGTPNCVELGHTDKLEMPKTQTIDQANK
ncbi:hypothetical protein [Neisseria iguanae]|uniref:Uncharacterized protein n=1 Tax=Neisseria iguanae TaxID=90242 RepID=A0A2P7TXS0_9NEIS|nr:hypothetical protein [Neisseria iguanae]PSJ79510.1 hypothetical protein C7N83_11815 [Neisseria iguanae]